MYLIIYYNLDLFVAYICIYKTMILSDYLGIKINAKIIYIIVLKKKKKKTSLIDVELSELTNL